MYTGKILDNQVLLFHDSVHVFTAVSSEPPDPDSAAALIAFALLTYHFAEDGEHLAEVKASELYECLATFLPKQLEVELDDEELGRVVTLAICQRATRFFDEYCGQQLYIQTLHTMLSHHPMPRAGPALGETSVTETLGP
jgi:hypothetical protein